MNTLMSELQSVGKKDLILITYIIKKGWLRVLTLNLSRIKQAEGRT